MKQCIFPFIVNGQFWESKCVEERAIREGRIIIPVATELDGTKAKVYDIQNSMATLKKVVFQLVEAGQQKDNYVARWFSCFWLVDDKVVLKEGRLYLKE